MKNKYCQNCRTNTKQIFVESIWRCEECFNTHSEFLPHPESLLHEIKLAGSQIIQYHDEIARLTQRVKELEESLAVSNMLDCQYCHKWFPTNKMFTVDSCSEEHQKLLGENNE